jgi:methionyl aminopeptidase
LIVIKSTDEIKRIADACRIAAEALEEIQKVVASGVTTLELDQHAESYIVSKGAVPAFKGYRGYPASLCASINEQVVHGIPSRETKLKDGDIISLDLGVFHGGYYGDIAVTLPVNKIDSTAIKLLATTKEALSRGIEKAVAGNRLSDISFAIQSYVEENGFSVVRNFVGHGIGRELHEDPQLPNFGQPGEGPVLIKGMVLAIEPMVNAGDWDTVILQDGWTAVTRDKSLSAHFEHTVAITDEGPKALTKLR